MKGYSDQGNCDDTNQNEEGFYTMMNSIDDVALVPEELRQDIAGNDSMCAYLSALLLIRSRDRVKGYSCLLYTSPSPRDRQKSRMPSSA